MNSSLPTGKRGQFLALGLTLVLLAALWVAIIHPLVTWYAERGETLAEKRVLAHRMAAAVTTLPDLRRQVSAAQATGPVRAALLEGQSDAVAGAALQGTIQQLAAQAGANLTSAETLPAEQAGAWRRIGVHVVLSAPWPVLIHLLQGVQESNPRMLADDVQIQASTLFMQAAGRPLDVSLTIFAFRAGTATQEGAR